MKVAKEFRWEMAHRLPFHNGRCKNLHGHSYRAVIEFDGDQLTDGMLIDFYDIFNIVNPIIDKMDHSILVDSSDKELLEIANQINDRVVVVDFPTTVENISRFIVEEITKSNLPQKLNLILVRVYETVDSYAEYQKKL